MSPSHHSPDAELSSATVPVWVLVRAPHVAQGGADHDGRVTEVNVAAALSEAGIPGVVTNGAAIGVARSVVARVVGWQNGRIARWDPADNPATSPEPSLTTSDVADRLGRALKTRVLVGVDVPELVAADAHELLGSWPTVAVGALRGWRSRVNARSPWTVTARPAEKSPHAQRPGYDPVASTAVGDIERWAQDFRLGVVMRRWWGWRQTWFVSQGHVVASHQWGPAWLPVDPSAGHRPAGQVPAVVGAALDAGMTARDGDAGRVADAFGLTSTDREALAAILAEVDPPDPWAELVRVLGRGSVVAATDRWAGVSFTAALRQATEIAEGWRPLPRDVARPGDATAVRRAETWGAVAAAGAAGVGAALAAYVRARGSSGRRS